MKKAIIIGFFLMCFGIALLGGNIIKYVTSGNRVVERIDVEEDSPSTTEAIQWMGSKYNTSKEYTRHSTVHKTFIPRLFLPPQVVKDTIEDVYKQRDRE